MAIYKRKKTTKRFGAKRTTKPNSYSLTNDKRTIHKTHVCKNPSQRITKPRNTKQRGNSSRLRTVSADNGKRTKKQRKQATNETLSK
ncbi:hypothetical protein B0A56_01850 [Flavobacterium columnare NBRC 100251 = ATCC 23463]|nr:hypothetical protein B0A56_01850 [Flavobacterium columnare NBRC 100251 = ATCC 23463]